MLKSIRYSLDAIKDEACELVRQGIVDARQPLYSLCHYFPMCQWNSVECELESNDFLLRDQILDLIGCQNWSDD